jgi:hypothetical protein
MSQTLRVRPRHAASLVLLRMGREGPEVLLGRRGLTAPFMPGYFVCPGGREAACDKRPLAGETGAPRHLEGAALLRLLRAALRETFEGTGILVGRKGPGAALGESTVERAFAAQGRRVRRGRRARRPPRVRGGRLVRRRSRDAPDDVGRHPLHASARPRRVALPTRRRSTATSPTAHASARIAAAARRDGKGSWRDPSGPPTRLPPDLRPYGPSPLATVTC